MLSDAGLAISSWSDSRTYASARCASSIPRETALRNASIPKVWIGHPHLQRAEGATQLEAAIPEVRVLPTPLRVLQVFGTDRERLFQRPHVLHHQAAGLEGLEEPLVGVHRDGVGPLDTGEERGALPRTGWRIHRRPPSTMQPDLLGLTEVRQLFDGIDGPRVRRARVSADRDRVQAFGAVLAATIVTERVDVDTEAAVRRDLTNPLGPDADDGGGPAQTRCAL